MDTETPITTPEVEIQSTGNGTQKTDTAQVKGGERIFTQEDLDFHAGKRAKQAAQAAINELLKKLGFERPEDLESTVTTAKQKQDAEKTELQRYEDKVKALEQKATQAEQKAAEAEALRISDRLDSNIRDAARSVSAQFPDDVVKFIRDAGELDELVSKEGVVDADKVKKRVEAVKKERPLWFPTVRGNGPGIPSNSGGHSPEPGKDALKRASALSQRTIRG